MSSRAAPSSEPGAAALTPKFRRVLFKMSGEVLMGGGQFGLDTHTVYRLANEVKTVHGLGVQVALVVGGGNIYRGVSGAAAGMERASADYMGMLATVINALSLQNALESLGLHTRVLSAIPMSEVCEPYIRRRAIRHLEKGRIVIFAAGTGNPYFTTDTAAALRANEVGVDCLLKGTKVEGVYSADPLHNPKAVRYEHLTYRDVLDQDLRVMDASAISLCRENHLPIIVFSIQNEGELARVVCGQGRFTLVSDDPDE